MLQVCNHNSLSASKPLLAFAPVLAPLVCYPLGALMQGVCVVQLKLLCMYAK